MRSYGMRSYTRRVAVSVSVCLLSQVLFGCSQDGGQTTGGEASAGSLLERGAAGEDLLCALWNVLLLKESDEGQPSANDAISRMVLNLFAQTSNLTSWRGKVMVGAGETLLCFDGDSGEINQNIDMAPRGSNGFGDLFGIAVVGSMVYAATSGGYVTAYDLAGEKQRWMTLACPVRTTGWLAQDEDGLYEDLPAAWACTVPAIYAEYVVVGFSSYQLENASTLVCLETATGEIRWTRRLEGRLDAAGGIGYPVAVDDGILLPMPDGTGLGLLSWQTGETLDLLETDSEIYMGLTMSEDGGLPCFFQSRLGTLYRVEVADGALVASSVQDACTEATKRVPSGACPLLVDDRVYVNAATQDEDAKRFDGDYDPSAGECVTFDARTLEVLERHDAPEIESSPVCVGDRVFYLGRAGIYRATLADGVLGEPELVFDGEGRDRDVWDQQLLAMDDTLFFVGGPSGERWLYAVG